MSKQGDSGSGGRGPPRAAAGADDPVPEQRWQNKSGLSVMKSVAPVIESSAPTVRNPGIPTAAAPAPGPRRVIASLDEELPPPGAQSAAPTFVPNWETSASRAVAAAADAAAEQAALAVEKEQSERAEKRKRAPPAAEKLRSAQKLGARVVGGALVLIALGALGGGVFAVVGAQERAAGPAVDDATQQEQRGLVSEARALRDPLKAIVKLDAAVALAPRSPVAGEALLARASRYLDLGALDNATADINLLRQRSDVDDAALEALIQRLRQKRPR